jgi:hypothetical protein
MWTGDPYIYIFEWMGLRHFNFWGPVLFYENCIHTAYQLFQNFEAYQQVA